MFTRHDGRAADQMRPLSFTRHYTCYAEGSVLVAQGRTKVLCNASVLPGVPKWMQEKGEGWITAEYGLLPRSTGTRTDREAAKGKQSGRTVEIQRLIGRSLRGVVDRKALGPYTIQLDCDVIQADAGTRCAAISGSWVALADAIAWMQKQGMITANPILDQVAAVSVGMSQGVPVLDFDYVEDSTSGTDMSIVMTGAGRYVEIQGTAEGTPFSHEELETLLALAQKGCRQILASQKAALASD